MSERGGLDRLEDMVQVGSSAGEREGAPWLRELRELLPPLMSVDVVLEALKPVVLPAWAGSTLHGGLGWALRELTCSEICAQRHELEPQRCAFARFFGARPPSESRSRWAAATAVTSLVLRPKLSAQPSVLAPGDRYGFGMVLVGRNAIDHLPALLASVSRMAERGLGRGRGQMRLHAVRAEGVEIWLDNRFLAQPSVRAAERWAAWKGAGELHLRSATPVHLSRRGRLIATPKPRDFVGPALRRLVALAAAHGGGEPAIHVADRAEELASTIEEGSAESWERFEATRWSERQGRRHEVVGTRGGFWASWVSASVASLLAWAGEVGVGKGTAMGLGQIEVRAAEPASSSKQALDPTSETSPRSAAPRTRPAPVRIVSTQSAAQEDSA